MTLTRRGLLHLAAGAAALPAVSHTARAQAYPARLIRLVIPFPPGGAFDAVGRPLADRMKPLLGTVVVENIGGGGGSLGGSSQTGRLPLEQNLTGHRLQPLLARAPWSSAGVSKHCIV